MKQKSMLTSLTWKRCRRMLTIWFRIRMNKTNCHNQSESKVTKENPRIFYQGTVISNLMIKESTQKSKSLFLIRNSWNIAIRLHHRIDFIHASSSSQQEPRQTRIISKLLMEIHLFLKMVTKKHLKSKSDNLRNLTSRSSGSLTRPHY